MARPPQASSLTTKVTFRIHPDEARRLDELVKASGFKDRSALLRAWLSRPDPTPQIAGAGSNPRDDANTTKIPVELKNNADETSPTRSNHQDEESKQTAYLNALGGMYLSVVLAIYRGADERSGWSRIPNAVRLLLPYMTPAQALMVIEELRNVGMLELSPPNGRYERVRLEDAAFCPRDSRGKILSRAKLTAVGLEFVACVLPPKPE
jgi:Ribbon-helix-helix protein, copG family